MTKRKRRPFPGLDDEKDPTDYFTYKVSASSVFELPDEIVLVLLDAEEIYIGDPAGQHVHINPTGLYIGQGATVYTSLVAGSLLLGDSANEHVLIDEAGVALYDGINRYGIFGATTVIGNVSQDHIYMTASLLQMRGAGPVVMAQLHGSTLTLGQTTAEHLNITSTAVEIKDGSTVYTQLQAGQLTLGDTAGDHLNLSSSGAQIKDGSTVRGSWETDGDIFIGSNLAAAATTYFSIFANAQTYNSESMAAGDMLIGDNSASKANILWDYSEGQLLFRGGTTAAAYIDTDGSLTAGSGNIVADADGITILNKDSLTADPAHAYAFRNSGGTITAGVYGADSTAGTPQNELRIQVNEESSHNAYMRLEARSGASEFAQIVIYVSDGTAQSISLDTNTPQIVISGDLLNINTTVAILPRINTTTRDGLTAVDGMIIYNTTTAQVEARVSGSWTAL